MLQQRPRPRIRTGYEPAIVKTGADRAQVSRDQYRRIAFDERVRYNQQEESQQHAKNGQPKENVSGLECAFRSRFRSCFLQLVR